MRILRGLLLAVIFANLFSSVYSQHKYIIQHYTNENGLPANGVKGIELDEKNGFLWVGTQAGLVRFDGANFKNFSTEKNSAVSRTALIARNSKGIIYSEDDNFSVYRITSYKPEWVMTDTIFFPFYQSKAWQSLYRAVNQLKERLKNHKRSDFLPDLAVFHDESGDSSSFTFLHFGHAYHYSAAADSLFDFPGFNQLLKIGNDVYFVDSVMQLWCYNDQLKKTLRARIQGMPEWKGKPGEPPRFIWKQGMVAPLLLWRQAIWKLQGKGEELQLLPLCSDCYPNAAQINSAQVWEEREMIFLGSEVNGLYIIKPAFLRSIRADTTTAGGQVEYAQAELTPGVITTGSGLSFTTEGQLLPARINLRFHPNTIYRDQQGDHWFNSGDTIIHLHRNEGRYSRIPLHDGSERMIFAEVDHHLYVFSDRAIGEISGEHYTPLYNLPYSAGDFKNWLNPDAVAALKPNLLAIATEKLMLFDTEKGTAPDTIPIRGLTVKVRALQRYGDYLLIGTYGQGFYIYKNGVMKKMPLDKNRYLAYAHCFVLDDKGFCWFSTNHGLFKASLQALVTAYENDLHEIYYHYFGRDDGMINTELNGGCQPCALKLSNGSFSFPSMDGLVVANPSQKHTPPPAGQVFIEEVLADTVAYNMGDDALRSLPYDVRNLRFKLALSRFGNAENIYFSYKLEPYNKNWETQDILQNNVLQFGGLQPGTYTLYVRVRNGFEPNQFGINTITFHILKPWYQTWWFQLLVLFSLVALVWDLVKWRTATITKRKEELQLQVALQTGQLASQLEQLQVQQGKLEEDNKIKARLIGIISHDMISPIRFMGFLSKKLRDGLSPSDQAWQTANAFVNVSGELESLSVNMLNWIRFHHDAYALQPEAFNLHDLVNESTGIAATLAKEKGVRLSNTIPAGSHLWQYRQAIGVIVYNLVMNAVKHTDAGEIRIAGHRTGDQFVLNVTDSGAGMSPALVALLNSPDPYISEYSTGDAKKFQFGYLIIKDLLQLVQGSLTVESTLQKGTTVTIRFKLLPPVSV
jgi:signal transduction histidine kinase